MIKPNRFSHNFYRPSYREELSNERENGFDLTGTIILIGLYLTCVYFFTFLFSGGFNSLNEDFLERKIVKKQHELSIVQADLQQLQHRNSLISNLGAIDKDLLDELARGILGFAHPNDTIFILDKDETGTK